MPDFFDIDDPKHTKECEDKTTNGLVHDDCFCICHRKYTGNNDGNF